MHLIINGIRQAPKYGVITERDQSLAKSTLSAFEEINYHDLWAPACLINIGLRGLSFIEDVSSRLVVKEKGICLLRVMIDKQFQLTTPSRQII